MPFPGRLVALASVAALLLVGGAFVLEAQAPEESASASLSRPHVTLYQNGLAFIEQDVALTGAGEAATVRFDVPASTRLGSVAFGGDGNVTVSQVRAPLHGSGLLQPGDRLAVHLVDGARFDGTLLRDDGGTLHLATSEGTTMIPRDKVLAIQMVGGAGGNATGPGMVELEARVQAPTGAQVVRVSYLAQGAGWTPSYRLDLDTGRLSLFATLTGLPGWDDVTLDLVSGTPHLAPGGGPPVPFAAEARALSVDAARAGFSPSEPLGSLHRFSYDGPVSLPAGEQVRLRVVEGPVSLSAPRHEAQAFVAPGSWGEASRPVPVRERIELTNTLNETLPDGILLAYRNGTWVGEDRLAATPPGARANMTLALVEDVTARLVRESASLDNASARETYALHIENRADAAVSVRASLAFPTERSSLVAAEPEPDERLGGEVSWRDELGPGASASYRITLEAPRERPPTPMPVDVAPSTVSAPRPMG